MRSDNLFFCYSWRCCFSSVQSFKFPRNLSRYSRMGLLVAGVSSFSLRATTADWEALQPILLNVNLFALLEEEEAEH